MKIRLKMFASLRDRSGVSETELDLPEGATAQQAVEAVKIRFAGLAELLPKAAVAVNRVHVPRSTVLRNDDELALLPPVSGG
jgi:molybdopterin converting factor subunit 1